MRARSIFRRSRAAARICLSFRFLQSGWRESDPRSNLGKVLCYHYNTPACGPFYRLTLRAFCSSRTASRIIQGDGLEEIAAGAHRDIRESETEGPRGAAATAVRLPRVLPEREDVRRHLSGQDRREVRRRPHHSRSEDGKRVRTDARPSDDRVLRCSGDSREESGEAPRLDRSRARLREDASREEGALATPSLLLCWESATAT